MTDPYLDPRRVYDRLVREYEKHGSLVVAYDFDGTVNDFHNEGHSFNGMITLLRDLKSIGCKLICWTAYKDLDYVEGYLSLNQIPCDGINIDGVDLGYRTRKPFYSALLDDRCGLYQVYQDLPYLERKWNKIN